MSPSGESHQDGTGAPARLAALAAYSPAELVDLFFRRWLVMLVAFAVIAGLGVAFALTLKPTFLAHTSILVRLGEAYVYQPGVGDAGRGATQTNDQIVQSELEILQSSALKAKVIADIGYGRLFPAQARAYAAASPAQRQVLENGGIRRLETGLKFTTAADTSVVHVTYSDKDPEIAALVLNTLIDEYQTYRRTVLAGKEAVAVTEQKRALEVRLRASDEAYSQFLADNHIGDIETEKASLAAAYGQLVAEGYSVESELSEAQGGLSAASRLSRSAPQEIGLFHDLDHTADDKLAQLRAERQDLAARYRPGAQPLVDKDKQIQAMEALAAGGDKGAGGARRVGVNPIWQTLQTEKSTSETRAASLASRKAAIARELEDLTARRQKIAALEPQYLALTRDRDILAGNVKTLAAREEELAAQQGLAGAGADNIRVVERAFVPSKGTSLKAPVAVLSVLLGLMSAALIGGLGLVFHRGYPSLKAAERRLGVPILAAHPVHA